ncbi:MAG: hypothetical protein WB778_04950 [Thermoplasmata archaeon]
MSESPHMVGGPIGTIVCALVAAGLFVAGFFQLAVCGTGLSFLLFGGAALMVGLAVYPAGGPTIIGMSGFLAFLFVVVGLVFAHGAGCAY